MPSPHHYKGETLYAATFGPLEVVSPQPFSAVDLEQATAEDPIWGRLGLCIDPKAYHHNACDIARAILLFMTFEESRTGVTWTTDPYALAYRIHLHTESVIIPLWIDDEL